MFFFFAAPIDVIETTRSRAFAEGFASALDIGGDITNPYREHIPTSVESIMNDFAEDYTIVTQDYARALDTVVKSKEK